LPNSTASKRYSQVGKLNPNPISCQIPLLCCCCCLFDWSVVRRRPKKENCKKAKLSLHTDWQVNCTHFFLSMTHATEQEELDSSPLFLSSAAASETNDGGTRECHHHHCHRRRCRRRTEWW
jgi:hypothetical protein